MLSAASLTALVLLAVLSLPAAQASRTGPLGTTHAEAPPPVSAPLVNMVPPSVFGNAIVGHTVTGFVGVWSSGLPLKLDYQWRRCSVAGPCADIPDFSSPVYFVGPGDVGQRIRLRVSAHSGGVTEVRDSEPTEVVADEREPETSLPPAPAKSPPPSSGAALERMIDPFPVVRIRGRFTVRWTRFTLVTVRAPIGAVIAMKCTGRGCTFRNRRRTVSRATPVRIPGLERRMAPGARLALRVTEPDRIGKYTRISVRRGLPPARWDGCVMPESAEPVACPSA